MSKPVTLRPRADSDIDEVFHHLRQHSPKAATRFLDAMAATCDLLGTHPAIGSTRHAEYFTDLPYALRFQPVKSFERVLVYYMNRPESVDVIRIWDAARGLDVLIESVEPQL